MNNNPNNDSAAIIERLRKIRWVDKYHTFHKIVPGVEHTPDDQQNIIIQLVEDCCTELIRLYSAKKKPTVAIVRSTIMKYMDNIAYTNVSSENRDFGYELCWYIAEKANINIRKYTDTKIYGYWKVENNRLKEVTRRPNLKSKP